MLSNSLRDESQYSRRELQQPVVWGVEKPKKPKSIPSPLILRHQLAGDALQYVISLERASSQSSTGVAPSGILTAHHRNMISFNSGNNSSFLTPYGGWLGPLSAILQFQLPLYFHPISTLFPLWTLTSTLFPLYFHSTSILFPLHFHPSTILLRIGGGGCRVPHHWLVGRVCGPLTLKPVVGPRIFLEHRSAGCRGSAIAS